MMPRIENGTAISLVKSNASLLPATDDVRFAEHPLEAILGHLAGEESTRRGGEGSASALHRRDITVAAQQPERPHAGGVDPKHGRLGAQQLERVLKSCVVGVAVGGDDEAGGFAEAGV